MKMRNIIESYNKQFESFEDYILKSKLVDYIGEKALRFSELSERYVWKNILKSERAKDYAMKAAVTSFAASDAAILYGSILQNENVFDWGVKGFLFSCLLTSSLAKTCLKKKQKVDEK